MVERRQQKRSEERVRTALPIDLRGAKGITRDLSASGVYFETDAEYAAGNAIEFRMDLDTPGGPLTLSCEGQIVRVEHKDGKVGVAVKITQSRLEARK